MGYVPPQGMGKAGTAEIPKPLLKGHYHWGYILEKLVPEYDNFLPIAFGLGYSMYTSYGTLAGSRSGTGGDSGYSVGGVIDTHGDVVYIRTDDTTNADVYFLVHSQIYDYRWHHNPLMYFSFKSLGAKFCVYKALVRMVDTTNLRVIITGNYYDSDLAELPNTELPYFRVFTDLDETNWMACQRDPGGGETVVDTGIALDDKWHVFKMECYEDKTRYYIDDELVAEITENIDRLFHRYYYIGFTLRTLEAATKEMRIAYALSGLVF